MISTLQRNRFLHTSTWRSTRSQTKAWFDVCFVPRMLMTSYLEETLKRKFSVCTKSLRNSSVREDLTWEGIWPTLRTFKRGSTLKKAQNLMYRQCSMSQPFLRQLLGVLWNPKSDQLLFDVTNLARAALELHPTKWNLASLIGKFYDPLGFLSPLYNHQIVGKFSPW